MSKKELPEAELVRKTFIIREMRLPPTISLTRRSMLRWFALAFGLISERESRDTILDVLDALFQFNFSKGKAPTVKELIEHFANNNINISEKLLRYHLKRLCDVGLLERTKMKYQFAVDPKAEKNNIRAGFRYNISRPLEATLAEIEIMLGKIAEAYTA